jgi:D-tyrosyl-tRNA(Tyr) deacylase
MLALLQRVREARVEVAGDVVGAIGPGLLMLVCAEPADTEAIAARLVAKVLKLRIFADEAGKMNRSLLEIQGGLLLVSQFTLYGDARKGR